MKKKKRDNIYQTLQRAIQIAKPHKKNLIVTVLIAIVINILELTRPYLIKVLIDDYLNKGIVEKGIITITSIGCIYIGIVLLSNLLDFIVRMVTNIIGEKIVFELRNRLFHFVQYASIPFHDKTSTGKMFVRITNDVEDIAILFKEVFTTSVKDIVLVIGITCMMIYFSASLSLVSLIVLPCCIFVVYMINSMQKKAYTISKNIRTKLSVFLVESIYGMKLIKIFNRQKEKQTECNHYARDYYQSRKVLGAWAAILPRLTDLLKNIGIALVVVGSLNHWLGIQIEVGMMYIFITYIGDLFQPIRRIIENIETIQESVVSIDKIYEILELEHYTESLEEGSDITTFKGKIEFKHVWFAYQKDEYVLKDVSFTILPNESAALVGKTGSGKTTITNLINRFYEIQKGEILLDGVNIQNISKKSLRRNIGIILQDPFLFAASVKENITLYADLSDSTVDEVLKLSSADTFVNKLPQGIHTVLQERGNEFSAGQKQLLSFARIFAHNPSIIILDEATANIDTTTEKQIQKAVDKVSKGKTSLFIAHRLSTIANVDKIIVLDHGEIIEIGNHKSLIKQNGYYCKLYQSYYTSLG